MKINIYQRTELNILQYVHLGRRKIILEVRNNVEKKIIRILILFHWKYTCKYTYTYILFFKLKVHSTSIQHKRVHIQHSQFSYNFFNSNKPAFQYLHCIYLFVTHVIIVVSELLTRTLVRNKLPKKCTKLIYSSFCLQANRI